LSAPILHAFIDEAGQRSRSARSSDHFIMSAVLVKEESLPAAAALLATIRTALQRAPGQTLHWRNLKQHSPKLYIAQQIGASPFLLLCSVVVCKRHLPDVGLNDDQAYLFTLRFLLERLSWVARDNGRQLHYTIAHVVRFKIEKLREYEAILRQKPDCQIAWAAMNPRGGRLDQPSRVEGLQLADTVASATFAAFEPDQFGNTEQRYLHELAPRLYQRGRGPDRLTSYGLKIHPGTAKTAYPWVAALLASTG
jgi:Protein of unknown function (DUF3800)